MRVWIGGSIVLAISVAVSLFVSPQDLATFIIDIAVVSCFGLAAFAIGRWSTRGDDSTEAAHAKPRSAIDLPN